MIKIENTVTPSPEQWRAVVMGARNPKNSYAKSDSNWETGELGGADLNLLSRLTVAGPEHAKFNRMLPVWVDVTAPLYWWKEADQYKVGTTTDSCSTMHTIHKKEFTLGDFSHEHLFDKSNCPDDLKIYDEFDMAFTPKDLLKTTILALNVYREEYLKTKDKSYWWQMIQSLPTTYNQKRTLCLNYGVLRNIYFQRRNHKLDEWNDFCAWIETLPYAAELITKEKTNEK